jgi:hypothetical protein
MKLKIKLTRTCGTQQRQAVFRRKFIALSTHQKTREIANKQSDDIYLILQCERHKSMKEKNKFFFCSTGVCICKTGGVPLELCPYSFSSGCFGDRALLFV